MRTSFEMLLIKVRSTKTESRKATRKRKTKETRQNDGDKRRRNKEFRTRRDGDEDSSCCKRGDTKFFDRINNHGEEAFTTLLCTEVRNVMLIDRITGDGCRRRT